MEPEFKRLITYERNALVEQEHYGIIIHLSTDGIIKKIGNDNNYKFYQRSCMKPLQAAKVIDLKLDEKYKLTLDEIAVMCASHTGDTEHQVTVRRILNKIGLDESYLLCAPQIPLSEEEKKKLEACKKIPLSIHNNCSGKHSAMLAICQHMGWNLNDYMNENHPLRNCIIQKVLELCEVKNNDYVISKDGCGLPTIATTLEQLGKGFLNLFLSSEYKMLADAFVNYPYLIGGNKRLDTEIIKSSNGSLIAKVGAGGLIVIVNPCVKECLIIKIADAHMKARALTAVKCLLQLGWLTQESIKNSNLQSSYETNIKTLEGEIIGKIDFKFSIV